MGKFFSTSAFSMLLALSLHAQEAPGFDREWIHPERCKHESLLNFRTNEATQDFDLSYCRLDISVDPAVIYIDGAATLYFKPLADDFQAVHLDLSDALTVDSVLYHGQHVPDYYFSEPFLLRIELPGVVANGALDSLTVFYQGAPVATGFLSFNKGLHAGVPVLWTLSEPYGSRDWWPCKQDLNDKIDSMDMIVRTPPGNRAASIGVLAAEWEEDGKLVYHWKHRYPIAAYLVAFAVTNYVVYSDFVPHPEGDIEVLNYVYPETAATAMQQTPAIIEIMQFFNEISGRYPFADEKYGHAQFGWGGGMEHQTMSFMGNFSYNLQAHEVAHQWYGDMITLGSWEDIWLNEGFATYWTALTTEAFGTAQAWHDWKSSRIGQITAQPGGSVWVDDTTNVNRIFNGRLSYTKGAMLLHMLRWVMGDENFFQAVLNYTEDPALTFGYACTADLQAHLEAVHGQSLQEFFNDWFYGQGHPSYQLLWNYNNGNFLLIADQTTSHASVSFFEMPLPIRLIGESQDTLIRLEHTQNGQLFATPVPWEVKAVHFDPDWWIVSANNSVTQSPIDSALEESLSKQLLIRPNPGANQLELAIKGDRLWLERVRIYDATGRLVDERQTQFSRQEKWDASSWPSGAYLLFIETGEGYVAKRWVKR
jgi:aminopeptidase N